MLEKQSSAGSKSKDDQIKPIKQVNINLFIELFLTFSFILQKVSEPQGRVEVEIHGKSH